MVKSKVVYRDGSEPEKAELVKEGMRQWRIHAGLFQERMARYQEIVSTNPEMKCRFSIMKQLPQIGLLSIAKETDASAYLNSLDIRQLRNEVRCMKRLDDHASYNNFKDHLQSISNSERRRKSPPSPFGADPDFNSHTKTHRVGFID